MKLFFAVISVLFAAGVAQDDYYGTTVASPVESMDFPEEEPGSGGGEFVPACSMNFIKHDKTYLRGVKEPNHVSLNDTTFEECAKICCYQTKIECKSFSYLDILKQCFIMNVTQYDDPKFELVPTPGHVHVELYEPETTVVTTTTTKLPFPTPLYSTSKTFTPQKKLEKDGKEPGQVMHRTDTRGSGGTSSCGLQCENNGKCRNRKVTEGIASAESYCDCPEGFEGVRCEKQAPEPGIPIWLIVVIVLGGLLLLLLLFVCIMCHAYKYKTGEYRVVRALRQWARRGRKFKSQASEDFIEPEDGNLFTSPTMSVASIHGSMTSSAHSTSTSV